MARKSPKTNFGKNYDSVFKKTRLQSNLRDNFNNAKSSFGNNTETLNYITEMAGNRAYSHGKRIAKINESLSGKNLSDSERAYAQSVLNTQYQHIKSTAQEGRKVKDFLDTAKKAYELKNNFNSQNGYAQFEEKTRYLDIEDKNIPVRFPKPSQPKPIEIKPANDLEDKVVSVDFTSNTKPGNVIEVGFGEILKGTANRGLALLTATVLGLSSLVYTACTPVPDPKDARIKALEKQKLDIDMKLVNTSLNYDRTMAELMDLKDKYTEATNNLANTSSNLTALTTNYQSATNSLDKAEDANLKLRTSIATLEDKNRQTIGEIGASQLRFLSASNQLHSATNKLASLQRDYSSATGQVSQLQSNLATAKADSKKAEERTRLAEEQLAKERKVHSKTSNQLQRTIGTLQARTREYSTATNQVNTLATNLANTSRELGTVKTNYDLALANNAKISTELNSNVRALAVEKSNLADRLVELKSATNELAKVQLQYTIANHAVNSLQEGLQKRTTELNEARTNLANTSSNLTALTASYNLATNNLAQTSNELFNANRTISKYQAVEQVAKQAEERRLEEGRTVDKLMSVSPTGFPLSIAQLDKKGKRLGNVKEIVYFGDGLVDTFSELRTFARAIGSTFTSTNHIHDAVIPIWFGDAKLSDTEIKTVLNEVPRQDLLSLGAFLQTTSTNSGMITFTNSNGNIYIMGPTKKLKQIIGDN